MNNLIIYNYILIILSFIIIYYDHSYNFSPGVCYSPNTTVLVLEYISKVCICSVSSSCIYSIQTVFSTYFLETC